MSDIIITGKDYSDLTLSNSNYNFVDNVSGEETKVEISNSNLSFDGYENDYINDSGISEILYYGGNGLRQFPMPIISINGKDINNIVNNSTTPYVMLVPYYETYTDPFLNVYKLRQESVLLSFDFTVKTTEILTGNIQAKCVIDYDTYEDDTNYFRQYIENNYNSTNKLVYNFLRHSEINKTSSSTNGYEGIPLSQTTYTSGNNIKISFGISKPLLNITTRSIITDATGTTITFNITTDIWTGYSQYFNISSRNKFFLNVANKLNFTITASTINQKTREFSYGDGENIYELESNELLQYTDTTPTEDLLSYKISKKIMEEFESNKQVVSFTLLNCTNRLKPGDLIKIKDVNDEYLGQYYDSNGNIQISYFEVISYRPRWNGKYYAEVICRQKY